MKNNYLERKIKLKTGFFKFEPFVLIINDDELILKQDLEISPKEFRIKISDIKTISIYDRVPLELEIISEDDSYIAHLITEDDKSEIFEFIYLIFGNKFSFY